MLVQTILFGASALLTGGGIVALFRTTGAKIADELRTLRQEASCAVDLLEEGVGHLKTLASSPVGVALEGVAASGAFGPQAAAVVKGLEGAIPVAEQAIEAVSRLTGATAVPVSER